MDQRASLFRAVTLGDVIEFKKALEVASLVELIDTIGRTERLRANLLFHDDEIDAVQIFKMEAKLVRMCLEVDYRERVARALGSVAAYEG